MSNEMIKQRETGILPDARIHRLWEEGQIDTQSLALDDNQIQPASIDLRLGDIAYRVRASFLPGPHSKVSERLDSLILHEIDISEGAVLETGCVYIIPLIESLKLAEQISASTNPKSSTGRLDIFTRVLIDYAREFDQVPAGYEGPLYLEVSPRTFPILARKGSRMSQIRFRIGESGIDDATLRNIHAKEQLVDQDDDVTFSSGISVSVDLEGSNYDIIGYRGKRHSSVIDIDKKDVAEVLDFWEPILARPDKQLILDPDEFYILASKEAVHVPPPYAVEMVPFDPLVGEFRVHYAGFFDPGFGHSAAGGQGSRAVLEVRSHEVPFILEHGQIVGRLAYEHMLELPQSLYGQDLQSNYQAQGLKLSKHFKSYP